MSQKAPVSSSARSVVSSKLTSLSPSMVQPSTSPDEPTWSSSLSSASANGAIIGGIIGGVGGLLLIILFALLFWTRWKRRLFHEQQLAIRRMTIVGPPSASHSSLPYPFLGRGNRDSSFNRTRGSTASNIEMSTSNGSTVSGKLEAGLPKSSAPAPTYQSEKSRVGRDSMQTLVADSTTTPDSPSVFSSKQSDIGDGDGIIFIDGIYVLALESGDERHVDRISSSISPRPPAQ